MKNIIQNLDITVIILIILISTVLIGTPLCESNVQIMYIASGLFLIFYFLKKLIKKDKIEICEIDIYICILTFSTLIPLIFKEYVTLTGTIHIILKYFCVLGLYLIVADKIRKNNKYIDVIINTIIISILSLCVIGLDEIHGNYLVKLKQFFGYLYIWYDEVRIGSLFSYPNAMAVVAGIGIFLCLGYVLKNKNIKIKMLYSIMALIMFITMILTYSRLVYIIFAIIVIIYLCILFTKYKIKDNIDKKIIFICIIISIFVIAYIILGLQVSTDVKINNEYQKILYYVEPDQDYIFKFDINAQSNDDNNFVVSITEKNDYFDNINTREISFGSYCGEKEIKIHTTASTSVMYLNIKSNDKVSQMIVSKAYLNSDELILKYKLLPTGIVQKIQSISLKNKSAWERLNFINDAVKLIKENWLCGMGGNAWRTCQYKVQSYRYDTTEVHSYPIQIFLEDGIIGFLACIAIIICLLRYLVGELRKKEANIFKISIMMAIVFLFLHSMLDFDMSFLYIQLIAFLLIATISENEKKLKIRYNNILSAILIISSFINIYVYTIEYYYKNNTDVITVDSKKTVINIYDKYYKLLPFNEKIKMKRFEVLKKEDNYSEGKKMLEDIIINEKYNKYNTSLDNIYSYIEICLKDEKNISTELEFALKYIKETEEFSKYAPDYQINRFNNIKSIVNMLQDNEEYRNKFQEQLEKEINLKEECILDFQKCRYERDIVGIYEDIIKELKGNNE